MIIILFKLSTTHNVWTAAVQVSVGSLGHPNMCRRPCVYVSTHRASCPNGSASEKDKGIGLVGEHCSGLLPCLKGTPQILKLNTLRMQDSPKKSIIGFGHFVFSLVFGKVG